MSWDDDVLDDVLMNEDQRLVRRIYLAQKEEEDHIIQNLIPHGHYMVKT